MLTLITQLNWTLTISTKTSLNSFEKKTKNPAFEKKN